VKSGRRGGGNLAEVRVGDDDDSAGCWHGPKLGRRTPGASPGSALDCPES
jgi:hypothetical protein